MDYEIRLDQQMVEKIAARHITLSEMHLGRFERALVKTRKHIDRIYRGQTQSANSAIHD